MREELAAFVARFPDLARRFDVILCRIGIDNCPACGAYRDEQGGYP